MLPELLRARRMKGAPVKAPRPGWLVRFYADHPSRFDAMPRGHADSIGRYAAGHGLPDTWGECPACAAEGCTRCNGIGLAPVGCLTDCPATWNHDGSYRARYSRCHHCHGTGAVYVLEWASILDDAVAAEVAHDEWREMLSEEIHG